MGVDAIVGPGLINMRAVLIIVLAGVSARVLGVLCMMP